MSSYCNVYIFMSIVRSLTLLESYVGGVEERSSLEEDAQ